MGDADWLKNNDPQLSGLLASESELDSKTRKLALEYRGADTEKQTALKEQLQELVQQQFTTRQQRRALELERLETELKLIRESIAKRDEARQSIVARHVAELIGEEPQF